MRTSITDKGISFVLTGPEALILAEELSDVPGGSKLRKVRQLHDELREALVWAARGAGGYTHEVAAEEMYVPPPPRRGRPPKKLRLVDDLPVAPEDGRGLDAATSAPEAPEAPEDDPFLVFVRSRLPAQDGKPWP